MFIASFCYYCFHLQTCNLLYSLWSRVVDLFILTRVNCCCLHDLYVKERQIHIRTYIFILAWESVFEFQLKLKEKRFTKTLKLASRHVHFPPGSTCRLVWLFNSVQLAESDPLRGKLLNFAIHTCFLCSRAAQFNRSSSFSKLKNERGCHRSESLIAHRCLKPDDAETGRERKPRDCSDGIRKRLIRTSVITNKLHWFRVKAKLWCFLKITFPLSTTTWLCICVSFSGFKL